MKKLLRVLVIIITFVIMFLLAYLVVNNKLATQEETRELLRNKQLSN